MNAIAALALVAAGLTACGVSAAEFSAAKCVWAEGRLAETNLTVAFERTFDGKGLSNPTLRISASAVYKAYLNGAFVGWGPARTVNGFARIDEWPLRLRAGANTLRVEVAGYGFESFQYNGGSPFFAAEVLSDGKPVLATPKGFVAAEVPRRKDMPVYSRQRGFPAEWTTVGGPAGAALPLVSVAAPKWLPRTVPYPDFAVNASFAATKDARGREMWKLPTVDSGFVGLKVRCAKPGRIAVEFDEALGTNGVLDLARNGDPLKSWHAMYNRVTWEVAEPGEYALESMEPYTVQFARIVPESGEFADVSLFLRRCRNARVAQSSFTCSDAELETMFAAAQASLAQNAVDIFTDCPSRERVGWLCDTFFSAETAAWLTGDFSIEREYLLNFTRTDEFGPNVPKGAVPGFMPSRQGGLMPTYMMWYTIQCAAAGERLGGAERAAFVEGVRARIGGIFGWLAQFEREGLLENLPGWVFIEWSKANDYNKGVNFPANMLWAMALERTGRMLGRDDWVAKAAAVRAKVRALAYDGTVFHDQALRDADGKLVLTAEAKTETCQYYAFFTSLVTPASHPALWRTLVGELGPYRRGHDDMAPSDAFIGYLLRLNVLARYGCGKELFADMKAYYLKMAKSSGTYWEFGDGHDSRCHAMGGYVAVLLLKEVFGIERIDWANRRVVLRKPSGELASASCRIPVAEGAIRVSCRGTAESRTLELPPGWTRGGDASGAIRPACPDRP